MHKRILAVDDEPDFLESVKRGLLTSGFRDVTTENDPQKATSLFEEDKPFDLALIDMTMPGMTGMELLQEIKAASPHTECIMVSATNEARIAVQCLRQGAYDYLVKPVSKEDLISTINRALEKKMLIDILELEKSNSVPELADREAFKPIVTQSEKMFRILKEAELHAASDVPILITGETGTGKELLAAAIHAASPRAGFVYTPINMDSMAPSLFDAEFFGHTRGAFTGAEKDRTGYLETAHRGTLFLDEIGNLPLELQGKLLRVLQEGEYIKLGTSTPRKTNVRFIAATNKNLEKMMAQKKFRKDLYYRLKVGWLHLPPLRERKDDIPALINSFVATYCGSGGADFEPQVMSLLLAYDYPGNIRELKSIIQSAVNLAQGKMISVKCLPAHLRKRPTTSTADGPPGSEAIVPLEETAKTHILKTYRRLANNKSRTATVLGISLNTLRRKIVSYGVK
jgi:two-component system response regulator AtoC